MQKRLSKGARWSLLISLFVLGLVTAVLVLPFYFGTKASPGKGLFVRTVSNEEAYPNYDIREQRDQKADGIGDLMTSFRQTSGKDDASIRGITDGFSRGEEQLRAQVPTLKVEYNQYLHNPEVIAPDPGKGVATLSRPAAGSQRVETLRNFLKQNDSLVGLPTDRIDQLNVDANYTNPEGNLSFVRLMQSIKGVPVFLGEVNGAFSRNGEMFRVLNTTAPGVDYDSAPTTFGNPADSVRAAFHYVSRPIVSEDTQVDSSQSTDLKAVFSGGLDATVAEKLYFPIEPGVVRAAWRVTINQEVNAYYVIIDAESGKMLWRKNITQDQTTSSTYTWYPGGSPAPLAPTTALPGSNTQPPIIPRTTISLIGNEPPNIGQDNLGWQTDGLGGANGITDGNNAEAGLDVVAPDGVDAPVSGVGHVFNFSYNPAPGSPGPGDNPQTANFQNGMVVNMFVWANYYHDRTYQVGFTEPARNFQNDNFGRGGLAADRVRVEGQDSSGTNNANFTTNTDGTRPKSQMYRFTGPTPNRDSGIDQEVMIHEFTHGLSNRLIGNNSGLGNNRGGSMGEGWGDFYARMLTSTAADDVNAVYSSGGWATLQFAGLASYTDNYYYGIRRFPYAVKTAVGGPNNRPHSPMTFADIDPAQANNTDGAYPISGLVTGGILANTANEVHNAGEVWCVMLFEVRARIITRLGWTVGNQRMLQITTDGMKLVQTSPNFLQARDAIIAADQNGFGGADVSDIWAGFATRGAGFGATDNGTAVVESFSLPNAAFTTPFSVSDSVGDNDGFPEPGENVLLNVSVTNNSGNAVTNVVASVAGGGSANYGTLANGQTLSMPVPFTIPAASVCGNMQTVSITVSSTLGSQPPVNQSFRLGVPVGGAPVTFSNTTSMVINDGATGVSAATTPYGTGISVTGLTGNKIMRVGVNGLTHTFPGDLDMLLVGPAAQKVIIFSDVVGTNDAVNTSFSMIDTASALLPANAALANAGEYRPSDLTSGDTFPAPAPAAPYLSAATVGSTTFATGYGTAGSGLNGTWNLYIVDDAGQDTGTISGGWSLTFEANDYACSLNSVARSRADFDFDGKTDLSVYRPSEGNWYLNRSTAGFTVANFGIASDTIIPGDFDGDGKTDIAVYRPSAVTGDADFRFIRSSDSTLAGFDWGTTGDVPVVGDYDGDGKTDAAVFRPSTSDWWVLRSSNGANQQTHFGAAGDVPVVGDFDGDGKTDLTVYRSGTWYIWRSTTNAVTGFGWGVAGDKLVPADYDGDNKDDIAVYRPSDGNWYVSQSSNGAVNIVHWGISTDVPVPGDYDGDGKDDQAVYRDGTWYVNRSTSGSLIQAFGLATDKAVPAAYHP